MSRLPRALLALLPLLAPALHAQTPAVEESLEVREAAILVELPKGADPASAAASLTVEELGIARPVTAVEALHGSWRVRVQIESLFCRPEVRRAALAALGERAAELVAFGPVEVAVGEGPDAVVLPPTRDAVQLAAALAAEIDRAPCVDRIVERIGEAERAVAEGANPAEVRADLWPALAAEVRERTDRAKLMACDGGACLLVLVAGGSGLQPDLLASEALRGPESDAAAKSIGDDRQQLAEALTVQGWRVLALAGFGAPASTRPPDQKAEQRAAGVPAAPPNEDVVFSSQPWMAKQKGPSAESLGRYLDLQLAGLRTLAARSGGAMVSDGDALAQKLEASTRVARVWIRTDSPRDGRAHEVKVVWTGSRPPKELPASRWLVARESEVLAAARERAGAR
jgi:hypothetical protein